LYLDCKNALSSLAPFDVRAMTTASAGDRKLRLDSGVQKVDKERAYFRLDQGFDDEMCLFLKATPTDQRINVFVTVAIDAESFDLVDHFGGAQFPLAKEIDQSARAAETLLKILCAFFALMTWKKFI
jgi:hypothetical protein